MTPVRHVSVDGRPAVARVLGRWVLVQSVGEPRFFASFEDSDPVAAQVTWKALPDEMTRADLVAATFRVVTE